MCKRMLFLWGIIMKIIKTITNYFSKFEISLWLFSIAIIVSSFVIFDRTNYKTLVSSIIGVTSLILNAKGNPFGQVLIIVFGILYGIISFSYSYYGEMITYLGMTVPMACIALVSWLKNPYNGKRSEVRVNHISYKEIIFMAFLALIVTIVFYFILKAFNTANLIPSTISVTTSFSAVYLTFRRSPYFAIAYALNDIVLIILWSLASIYDISYVSVVICFAVFLVNDIYSFVNWLRIGQRQSA